MLSCCCYLRRASAELGVVSYPTTGDLKPKHAERSSPRSLSSLRSLPSTRTRTVFTTIYHGSTTRIFSTLLKSSYFVIRRGEACWRCPLVPGSMSLDLVTSPATRTVSSRTIHITFFWGKSFFFNDTNYHYEKSTSQVLSLLQWHLSYLTSKLWHNLLKMSLKYGSHPQ